MSVDGLALKLTPIRSGRHVQLTGFKIQFAGRTTPFRMLLVMLKITRWRKAMARSTIDDSLQPSTAAVRGELALDVADEFGYVVDEVEVMSGESPQTELRRRALRPVRHLLVRGNLVVLAQEGEDRAGNRRIRRAVVLREGLEPAQCRQDVGREFLVLQELRIHTGHLAHRIEQALVGFRDVLVADSPGCSTGGH